MLQKYFPNALSIYKWGSCVVPYIKNPNDIDYLVIYENEETYLLDNIPEQNEIGIHFFVICLSDLISNKYLSLNKLSFYKEHKRTHALFQLSCSNINLLMFHWCELVEGENLNLSQYFNIEKDFEAYKSLYFSLNKAKNKIYNKLLEDGEITKHWYYICLGYYIFLNKNYTLQDYQIEKINNFHDLTCSKEDCFTLCKNINNLLFDY